MKIGNIDVDLLFIAPKNGNFTPQESSPCIDAGTPNSPFDPDGTITDMGAFYYDYYNQSQGLYGDVNQDGGVDILDVIMIVNIILGSN